ncbi:MAG TPA: histidine phosphatase family protein [Kiritimatiellia bacterium]|nr:histidine phosphatase family protein [Kiritimatiellia bacterium]
MRRTIYIVRHGLRMDSKNPEWRLNADYPQDPALSARGFQQAYDLAQHLKDSGIRHIYSSPYLRARQTAQPLADMIDVPVQIEDGLREWLNPEWTKEPPRLCEYLNLEHSLVRPSFPETDEQAWLRSGKTALLIAARHDCPLLMVTHGHTMCGAVFGLLNRRDIEVKCDYCSLTEIHLELSGATMIRNGDRSFLKEHKV